METRDLRIGNLMQDRKGRLCEVLRLSKDPDEVRISSINSAITSMPIEPIPLTEEWLLRIGFTKQVILGLTVFRYLDLEVIEFGGFYRFEFYTKFNPISYVHQLQNVYLSLVGEELPIPHP